jgi:hypothetical protein
VTIAELGEEMGVDVDDVTVMAMARRSGSTTS